jgi:N-acetylglucosamine kinase-like BadF-type ATPase
MNDPVAVGVDAGGTSTVAALSRGGRYEQTVRGGPANATSRGAKRAVDTIVATVFELTGSTEAPHALFVGAAGAGRAEVLQHLQTGLRGAFPATRIAVDDDTRTALRAALPTGDGLVLIAGTGSVAYAERGDVRVRVGGSGYLLGDEGSAFSIGLAALRLLARVYDGRAQGDETTAFAARALDAPDRDALLHEIYARPLDIAKIASLAPGVIAFAGKGNRVASKIVQSAAQDLGDLVKAAARQAGFGETAPPIAFAGGLLRENTLLSYLLETRLVNEIPGACVIRLRDEPARAALRFAEAMLV